MADTLAEVMPQQAGERVGAVYEDIRQTLRVPFVNFLFRTLARDEDYLQRAWAGIAPLASTRMFERAAAALRPAARLEEIERLPDGVWPRSAPVAEIRAFTDSIYYVLPKLLLIATALREPSLSGREPVPSDAPGLPRGVAADAVKVEMVNPDEAEEHLARLFERIRTAHGHPRLATYFRSLGQWPEFLETAWDRLRPHVGSPAYVQRRGALVDLAQDIVRGLPFPNVPPPQGTIAVADILDVFRTAIIPDLLLDVTALKVMLEGSGATQISRLDV